MDQSTLSPSRGAIAQAVKFARSDDFLRELKKRVDAYFTETGRKPRDCPQMYFKTATIMAWFVATYILLVFVVSSWWLVVPLAITMGLAMAAVGFNIQHDGGHKAYSDHKWVNRIMAMSLDLIGGSSYLWDWKHNSIHHTYPNVTGHDDDIDVGILGRLSPHQKRYWFHRMQSIYLWVLYGLLAVKWHLYDDFYCLAVAKIGSHKIPRPKGLDLVIFIGGKLVFFSWAFVIPMIFHPVWAVLSIYLIASFSSGVVLSVVFQLAHCVEEAEFPMPNDEGKMDTDWAVHQVQTTVDFSRRNLFLSWFLGGLNFQVEHHLFHRICHIHYPALSKVVEKTCQDCGIAYSANTTFLKAVASHFRWLHRMGQPVT
ncbi:MAG TPA: acyl-CoA desaturase [Tepidisphaeraceae bacterium]|nr:acyl-CoA desaturase [Tepidisphaeraceae bacterium]